MAGWQKGQSGNPKGRPRGSKDRRTLLFNELVPHGTDLVSKAVALALEGDAQMLSLCLNKLIANPRPVERQVDIGSLRGTLADKGDALLAAVARGRIAPTEVQVLMNALAIQAKLVEHEDLVERIEALEYANSK
jgi:hypothetical protein